jgi:hypothetical protein
MIVGKLIPGFVALGVGILCTVYYRSVVQLVLGSHRKFWGETLKLSGELSSFSRLFLVVLVLTLGVALILIGLLLIYRSWQPM